MWNHNTHFHNYLLRQIPQQLSRALDVGCGLGNFAFLLAERAEIVDALDVDYDILKEASNRHSAINIFYQQANFLEANLPENSYDLIVLIASLHHMDFKKALEKIKLLLNSSGKLIILGLYRETTILDYIYSITSIPLNLIYLNWHRQLKDVNTPIAPTIPPQLSLNEIKLVAKTLIPGFTLKRHLFWRYSLVWQKP